MTRSGEFFFTLMSGKARLDGIYHSTCQNGAFGEPVRLPDTVNVSEGSFDGVVSADGNYYLVDVTSKKEDSFGETDIYVTFRSPDNGWSSLINLGPTINSKMNETVCGVSPDGQYLFFCAYFGRLNLYHDKPSYRDILYSSQKPGYGNADIYWVSTRVIERLRPPR